MGKVVKVNSTCPAAEKIFYPEDDTCLPSLTAYFILYHPMKSPTPHDEKISPHGIQFSNTNKMS